MKFVFGGTLETYFSLEFKILKSTKDSLAKCRTSIYFSNQFPLVYMYFSNNVLTLACSKGNVIPSGGVPHPILYLKVKYAHYLSARPTRPIR